MKITERELEAFRRELLDEELAPATVQRYLSAAGSLARRLDGREITKELLLEWRAALERSPGTVNVAVAAVNRLLAFLGLGTLRLRHVRTQRCVFRPAERELTKAEYERLVTTAERRGQLRLARAIETICALGIRVSELRYVTVEALEGRAVTIRNKGKTRTILLSGELTKKLRQYAKRAGITGGPVFVTRRGKALRRTQLWAEMKRLCGAAGVEASKVFPHNLRHLFALTHYRRHKDVVRLADLLGHSSVNTTRIYLKTSGAEHQRELEKLGLVLRSSAA